MSNTLLRVYPSELKIPFEVKKQRSCCMQLTNRTDQYVAFKVKTTNPRKYSVRHTFGVLLPRSSCSIRVTMQAPMEVPPDYHCKDKFLVQSVVVRDAVTTREFVSQLFTKAPGRVIEEFKLRVVYIAANPPSPVPEEAEEEDSSPRAPAEVMWNGLNRPPVCDAAPSHTRACVEEPSCAQGTVVVSKLAGEREYYALDENQKLREERELFRVTGSSQQGFSLLFVLFVFMSSVFVGHLMNGIKV